MAKEKIFHIQGERGGQLKPIPLSVILPHERQAYRNHGQSLLTIDRRGGLTPKEALMILYEFDEGSWAANRIRHKMTTAEADKELRIVVKDRYVKALQEKERKQIYHPCTHPERPAKIDNGVRKCGKCGGWVAIEESSIL